MSVIAGLTRTRWPAHPHRLDDELLSSLFARTAYANGLKVQSFASRVFGPRAIAWSHDYDRCATARFIDRLSEQTGSSVEELYEGTLASYEGRVFERLNLSGNTKWILPSVFYLHQRRRFGMQFCPLCLFFDKQPYYRRRWRMAFATICDVHGTMLHDRCPECGAPVIFFRNDLGDSSSYRLGDLVSCWECGFDLRRAPAYCPSGPDGRTIMALRSLVTFHDLGWWHQGKNSIQYGPLYFEVLHRLTSYLPSRYGRRFLNVVERETGWKVDIVRERRRCEFESKPIGARHQLLMAILWLLDDWPDRFIRVAHAAKSTQSQINDGRPFPFWFESVLRTNLGGGFYNLGPEEVAAAAAYLRRTGKEISASAIGRLLGRKDAQVVRPYVKSSVRPFDDDELRRIVEHYDAGSGKLPASSRPRLVWQRDKTILKLIQLTGWPYKKIRKLKVGDVARFSPPSPGRGPAHSDEIMELLLRYLRETRRYMAGEESDDALFVKWKGCALNGKSWRCRFQRYKGFL